MTNLEVKLLSVLDKDQLSGYSLRRLMRNYLSAADVDRLLERLRQDGTLTVEDGLYKRVVDQNDPTNWQQA